MRRNFARARSGEDHDGRRRLERRAARVSRCRKCGFAPVAGRTSFIALLIASAVSRGSFLRIHRCGRGAFRLACALETVRGGTLANSFAMSAPAGDTATLTVAGDWSIHQGLPSLGAVQKVLASPSPVRRITLQSPELRKWDSALLTFILSVEQLCGERGVAVDAAALPAGVRSLIELATAAPPRTGAAPERAAPSFVTRLGRRRCGGPQSCGVRNVPRRKHRRPDPPCPRTRPVSTRRSVLDDPRMRRPGAPIVSIISLLVGMIFAFIGAQCNSSSSAPTFTTLISSRWRCRARWPR